MTKKEIDDECSYAIFFILGLFLLIGSIALVFFNPTSGFFIFLAASICFFACRHFRPKRIPHR